MANLKLLTSLSKRPRGVTVGLLSVLESASHRLRQPLGIYDILSSRHLSQGEKSFQSTWSYHRHVIGSNLPGFYSSAPLLLTPGTSQDNETVSLSQVPDTNHQYVCPSRLGQLFSQLVIRDNLRDIKSYYDCPISSSIKSEITVPVTPMQDKAEILEPPPIAGRNSATNKKEAKEIMRIRHKKMKKHKLRKLRKRMYFLWKKQKAVRKAKRDAVYWKEIADIKQEATDFDAETFVKDQLQKARKGGFYIKVLESKSC